MDFYEEFDHVLREKKCMLRILSFRPEFIGLFLPDVFILLIFFVLHKWQHFSPTVIEVNVYRKK